MAGHDRSWRLDRRKLVFPDGRVADIGEIVEIEAPKRLILRWRNQFRPDLHEEGYARWTMDIGQAGEVVRLTSTHEIDKPDSKLIGAVSIGWPINPVGAPSLGIGHALFERRARADGSGQQLSGSDYALPRAEDCSLADVTLAD